MKGFHMSHDYRSINYHQVQADPSSRISPAAGIIGDVTIGACCSVFAGAQIRGDDAPIVIEDESNIQEGAILHVDPASPLTIHRRATIGHGAILHGCEIGENTVVGMGAIVMNDARIGANSVVAAGALIPEGKVFEEGSLIVGMPAKQTRRLSAQEIHDMCTVGADDYLGISARMVEEGAMFNPSEGFDMHVGA